MNIKINTKSQMSGFKPIPKLERPCSNPSHNPPSHLCIPQGQQYEHVCPSCGQSIILHAPQFSL